MQFAALIADSIRDSLDRRIFWVMVVMTVLVAAAMAGIGIQTGRISLGFGLWEFQTEHFDPASAVGRARLVGAVIFFLMDVVIGWIGMILMIVATASAFPNMLEPGMVGLLLSKPISRQRLFVYKYLASLVFVLIQASLFVGLTFLVMGARWGVWAPRYFMAVPLLVLLFSYVYCISVLVAVRTQSAVSAILISLGAWVLYTIPPAALGTLEQFPSLRQNERLYRTIHAASWIPPKTGDIVYLAARWAKASPALDVVPETLTEAQEPQDRQGLKQARRVEQEKLRKNPILSIGSSLIFEAAIVLWAMWIFARRDY